MGCACSKNGRDAKYITKVWSESLKGRDNLEDLGADGKVRLK
jgi:hypothetical protein